MIYQWADIGPFEIKVNGLTVNGVELRITDGESRDLVEPETFPAGTATESVWSRAIELFEAKIGEWRRGLMQARSLYQTSPPTLDSALAVLTFDDLGTILAAAGVDLAESLPGRKQQLQSILYRNHG